MKITSILIIIFVISIQSFAQIEVKAVMGINFLSVPSMQDYINQNFAQPGEQLGSFNSAVIFAGEGGYFLSPSFMLSMEGAFQLFSFTSVSTSGKYELIYSLIPVSLLGYYVIGGNGYNLKFGGGLGPRFVIVEESRPALGVTENFNSTGAGFLLRIEGNTLLGSNFYANIGADLRYDFTGEPENNGEKLYNIVSGDNVNFNTLALGVRLGFTYYFGVSE